MPAQFSVDLLSSSAILVGLLVAVLFLVTLWHYIRTNPPIPMRWRIVLGVLRSVAIVALALVLFETVVAWTRAFDRKPRATLLVDASQSMAQNEGGRTRAERIDSLLSSQDFASFSGGADVHTIYFGTTVSIDKKQVGANATALGDALATVNERELTEPSDRWILFSDGNSNAGRTPQSVSGLRVPIFAIDVSSGGGDADVGIIDITVPSLAYTGQLTPLRLTLSSRNMSGKSAVVSLSKGNSTVIQKQVTLQEEGGFVDVDVSWVPAESGDQLLTASVATNPADLSEANNSRSFSIKVLKSRLTVLLASENPDYEVGFLHRHLMTADKYDITFAVTTPNSGNLYRPFPSRVTELNKYDVVILYDPNPQSLSASREALQSYMQDRGGAIWVFYGERYARNASHSWFNDLMPISPMRVNAFRYAEFHAEPVEGNLFHPALRLADDQSGTRSLWSQLPPFSLLVQCESIHSKALVLAQLTSPSGALPVLATRRHGPGKVLAVAASPLWTWSFLTRGFGEDNSAYAKIVDGSLSWLTVRDDVDPIRISPDKRVFTRGESVGFTGTAFDPGFRPLPSVNGQVTLIDSSGARHEMDFMPTGDGQYHLEFSALPPGDYTYSGVFEVEGKVLKQSDGSLIIESYSLEEMQTEADPSALQSIASATGGRFYPYTEFHQAMSAMKLEPVPVTESRSIPIWSSQWLLAIFIAALSIEWAGRKMLQLL